MRLWKSIAFTIFLTSAVCSTAFAQANSLKQIAFIFDRYNGYNSSVTLRGDNIDITAQFRSATAPVACSPCSANSQIAFGPALDDSGIIAASGTIDGVFYPALYVRHSLNYSATTTPRIPKFWTKTVRVTAPLTLSGNIGVWRTPEEEGNNSLALYLHNGINFTGNANLTLRWLINGSSRLYGDKYLAMTFAYSNN
jgi:hypothetical protein